MVRSPAVEVDVMEEFLMRARIAELNERVAKQSELSRARWGIEPQVQRIRRAAGRVSWRPFAHQQ